MDEFRKLPFSTTPVIVNRVFKALWMRLDIEFHGPHFAGSNRRGQSVDPVVEALVILSAVGRPAASTLEVKS